LSWLAVGKGPWAGEFGEGRRVFDFDARCEQRSIGLDRGIQIDEVIEDKAGTPWKIVAAFAAKVRDDQFGVVATNELPAALSDAKRRSSPVTKPLAG
jgi:hypothetical protein